MAGGNSFGHLAQEDVSMRKRVAVVTIFARLSLGFSFLSAVADRFGLWGPYGIPNVAWGDFGHFTAYT